ncbi:MAG TPA: hypothetical protein VMB35_04605 [Methanomicrobiales archaeon]|nr:hypothetical protein [Methanomicrobiales archaeon]
MTLTTSHASQATSPIMELTVKRSEVASGRVLVKGRGGTDLIVELPRGAAVQDGDIIGPSPEGVYYRARFAPEPALRITLEDEGFLVEDALILGCILGMHGSEVLTEGRNICVPVGDVGAGPLMGLVRSTGVPVRMEVTESVISPAVRGYFPGRVGPGSRSPKGG